MNLLQNLDFIHVVIESYNNKAKYKNLKSEYVEKILDLFTIL